MSGVTIYAVEHGDYSDRRTEVLFTNEALAEAYIDARMAAAKRSDLQLYGYAEPDDWHESHWYIQTYQLWDVLPLVPDALDRYEDLPE